MVHKLALAGVGLSAATVLAAGVVAAASGFQSEESKGDPMQDPCYNLPPEECDALIQKSEKEYIAKFEVWLAEFNAKNVDLRTLPTA